MTDNADLEASQVYRQLIDSQCNSSNIVYLETASSAGRKSPVRPAAKNISRSITSNAAVANAHAPQIVSFHRTELDQILNIYSYKVADGQWRDYAIDMLKDRAIFSVFRRSSEVPLHCIEKNPKLARKQGTYSVTGADGRILKRGHELASVLKILAKN